MCNMCGIVSENLKPESSYWRKMCKYVTQAKRPAFFGNGCTASSKCDFYIKDIAGNKCFAILDGEILNYDRIRQSLELRGVVFSSRSHAELALLGYFVLGKSIAKIFRGEFSIAIWDGYEEELVLFRDKMGFKSLFYYYDGMRIVFCSQIKGILKFPFVKKEFCDDIYCKLFTLAGSKLNTDTLFKKVYEVPPSAFVVYKNQKVEVHNYFVFNLDSTTDSFKQTVSGLEFLLKGKEVPNPLEEKIMTQDEMADKIEEFITRADMPSPYVDLRALSNQGVNEQFADLANIFSIPRRFKLPIKDCESGDKEFINDFLSTLPPFSYKDEKDITKKEEMYIKLSIVLPQYIYARRNIGSRVIFPYLEESVAQYCLKSMKYGDKLQKFSLKNHKERPQKENVRVLKSLFYKMLSDKNAMLGFVEREELLKFTRLFPRPETMLYLVQVNIWLNRFL